jgi:hypothetical protein
MYIHFGVGLLRYSRLKQGQNLTIILFLKQNGQEIEANCQPTIVETSRTVLKSIANEIHHWRC